MLLGFGQEEMWTGRPWKVRFCAGILVLKVSLPHQTLVRNLIFSVTLKPSFNECYFSENRSNILNTWRGFSGREQCLSSDLPLFQPPDNVHHQRKLKWSHQQCGMVQEAALSRCFLNQLLERSVQVLLPKLLKLYVLDQWLGTVISAPGFLFAWFPDGR